MAENYTDQFGGSGGRGGHASVSKKITSDDSHLDIEVRRTHIGSRGVDKDGERTEP